MALKGRKASLVLANPPFGKKSSITVVSEDGKATREDVEHFTLRTKALRDEHLDDFVEWYLSGDRPEDRKPNDRIKLFDYDELVGRDKVNLDPIGWGKDESADELLSPEAIAAEIVEDLQAALSEFAAVAEALGGAADEA